MEDYTKWKDCNIVFVNAWHIFMLTLWFEKIMIDLLIFNAHKKAIKNFNKTSKSITLWKYRKIYWEKYFWDIFNEFIDTFNPTWLWLTKLETVFFLRNWITHSKPSIYKESILIKPEKWRKLKKLLSKHSSNNADKRLKWDFYKINFYDYENYSNHYNFIIELDEKYFKYLAENMWLIYNKIR